MKVETEFLKGPPSKVPCVLPEPHSTYCVRCWLREFLRRLFAEDAFALHGQVSMRELRRNDVLYRKGEPFHSVFAVREGLIKSVAMSYEGQAKIASLHLPGEMFALHGISEGRYLYDGVASTRSEVCVIPHALLQSLVHRDIAAERKLFQVLSRTSARHRVLANGLEHLNAERRVAALLLNLSTRYVRSGHDLDHFPMPLTRVEIASYTGLAHETVSRIFSSLSATGLVEMRDATIRIVQRDSLRNMVGESAWTEDSNCGYFAC